MRLLKEFENVANQEYRNTLSQRSRPVNYCDYAIFSVGVTMQF